MKHAKWIKVGIEYLRTNGDHGTTNNILNCKEINRHNVGIVLKNFFSSWASEGAVKILNIETGPYQEDQILPSDIDYFVNKVYSFNN